SDDAPGWRPSGDRGGVGRRGAADPWPPAALAFESGPGRRGAVPGPGRGARGRRSERPGADAGLVRGRLLPLRGEPGAPQPDGCGRTSAAEMALLTRPFSW